ncbi:MAG: GDSL-type esterase/lipase family protein [Bacteroidota bacterium]
MKAILFTGLLCSFFLAGFAQDDPYEIVKYDFIRYDTNRIDFFDDSVAYCNLFNAFSKLILKGEGQINVLHIGDSHLQADYFSGRMRQRLQTFFQGGLGGRGFVFPYRVALTNNPFNLRTDYSGEWESCKNIEKNKQCDLGLSGISVTTYESGASISIYLREKDYLKYDYNRVKIFHNIDSTSFSIEIRNSLSKSTFINNDTLGYTIFSFDRYLDDTLTLRFIRTDSLQQKFTLHGLSFETDDPGVIYHTIGVNGADVDSYLRCNLFSEHLLALAPDWVIISLGTNDAYMKSIDTTATESDFDRLITRIQGTMPGIPILLTTPGDSYRYRRYLNENIPKVRGIIYRQAEKHNCAVWDFFSVMGGLNSVTLWYRSGLTAKDKLHLNGKGYILQGDLMFNAFLKAYDDFIDKELKN